VTTAGFFGDGLSVSVQGSIGTRTLLTGSASDTVNVFGISPLQNASASLVIFTGGGNDTINVGSAANSVDVFAFGSQSIRVDGGAGTDTVNYNDQGSTTQCTYQVTTDLISRVPGGFNAFRVFTENTVEARILNGSMGTSSYTLSQVVGNITVNAGSGSDYLDASGVSASASAVTLNGGQGNDTLVGGKAPITLNGNAGNDLLIGGDASDTFTWNPGDGSDVIEGGSGSDRLVFNGSAADESFTLSSVGTRFELLRSVGGIGMDVADVEEINLNMQGGADQVTVNDLGAASVTLLHVNTGSADATVDTITLEGSALPDYVQVSAISDSTVLVEGLSVPVDITGYAINDQLIVNGNGGIDVLRASLSARGMIGIVLNGEPGASFPGNDAFSSPTSLDVGKGPQSIAAGDVNGDTFPDLVVAHSTGISILLGNGTGVFQPATTIVTGGKKPSAVVLGQFDSDADLDIAVTHSGSGNVGILLGNGDGTFGDPTLFRTGKGIHAIRAVQLDAGENLDLVIATKAGRIGVLLGNGDGTFQDAKLFAAGGKGSRDFAVADFNADGKVDIAVANRSSNNVGLLLGNGDGTFANTQKLKTGISPSSLTAGDFDGDGAVDLVVAHATSRFISVLLGNGGTPDIPQFDAPLRVAYSGPKSPISIASNDLDNDGRLDLIVANRLGGSISALIGLGNGTFALPFDYDLGNVPPPGPIAMAVADFNQDSLLDIVTANQRTNDVSILLRVS
jgi:hypothetical protein